MKKGKRKKHFILICFILFAHYALFAQGLEEIPQGEVFREENLQEKTFQEENLQEEAFQEDTPQGEASPFLAAPANGSETWICPSAEIGLYSANSISYGAGLAAAYGKKVSVGLKASFLFDAEKILDVLEINFLLRWYPLPSAEGNAVTSTGPFFQFSGGPAIFFDRRKDISLPAGIGRISAGLGFGWRFPLDRLFFIEPSIRAGYPFIVGAALSTGIRF